MRRRAISNKSYIMKKDAFFGLVTLGLLMTGQGAFATVIPIVGPVVQGGSDAASMQFLSELPAITTTIKAILPEYKALNNATAMALDPTTLRFSTDTVARLYFVSEGAAYRSILGFNTLSASAPIPTATTPGILPNAQVIFPNLSSSAPGSLSSATNSVRTASEPLLPGDFVNLGTFSSGTLLDFFLIPNGASGGSAVLTEEALRNSDKLQHFVSFTVPGSSYTFFALEDQVGGGDHDYNDAIFALQLSTAPEPGTWVSLCALSVLVGIQTVRRRK